MLLSLLLIFWFYLVCFSVNARGVVLYFFVMLKFWCLFGWIRGVSRWIKVVNVFDPSLVTSGFVAKEFLNLNSLGLMIPSWGILFLVQLSF